MVSTTMKTTMTMMYSDTNLISFGPNVTRHDRIPLKKSIVGILLHPSLIREDFVFYLCFVITCRATESVARVSFFCARHIVYFALGCVNIY